MVSADAAGRFLSAPWLAEMAEETRQALLAVLEEGRTDAGATLVAEGGSNDRIFFLLEGAVTIARHYPGRGEELVVTLAAPSHFGETSFFQARPSIVQIRATSPAWYLSLSREAHAALRRDHPRAAEEFALAIVRLLADRFDMLDQRVSSFLHEHENDRPRASEWAAFRKRLFEESSL